MSEPDPTASNVQQTYIGDSVYAEFDGYNLRLYAQSGNNIWFEPREWNKLEDKKVKVRGI